MEHDAVTVDGSDNIELHSVSSSSSEETMKSIDWKPYSSWLSKEGYQPSTIAATLRNLRVVRADLNVRGKLLPHYEAHIKRYMRFVDHSRKNPLGDVFLKRLQKAGFEPSSKRRKHGRRIKELLSPEDWALLKAKLRKGDDISKLLCAYMVSGVRVSVFLNWLIREVDEDLLSDKVSRDWIQGWRKDFSTSICRTDKARTRVFQILCETERCAYSRMRMRLQELGEELKLSVDLDTLYKSHVSLQ